MPLLVSPAISGGATYWWQDMKIIIVGAGRIGTNLAKLLAEEGNDVYLIERNEKIAQKILRRSTHR